MASRYFRFCRSGLYRELKVTISNDLVSRSKRPFDDFQEGEQALEPDVKKQRCGSPFLSQKTSLASIIPSSSGDGTAGSQVYSQISNGDYDDSDLDSTILEYSDGESPDSIGTLEDEDRLLADDDDLEIDTSDVSLGSNVKEVGSGFAEASIQVTVPNVSPELLPQTGHSDPSSSGLPHSSAPANPGSSVPANPGSSAPANPGSNTNVDSQNQTCLSCSPDGLGLQDVSIEAGSFSLKKGDNGCGIVDKEATQTGGEESPVVSQLIAGCEFASVATDRPSEGQAFIEQSEVGGESASKLPCETQEETNCAAKVAAEHSITAPNEDHVEDSSPEEPENPSPEEREDPSPDDSRRHRIFIGEGLLQSSKQKYVENVHAHAQHRNLIGAYNELQQLMSKVASEYYSQEPNYRHPADLTMRNYGRRTNREIQKCSLEKWVDQNGRNFRRFADIPDKFERSPIPSR